jgi:transcriptional regulator with XRE-family HTH domain
VNTYQIVRNLVNRHELTIAELERRLNFSNGQIRRWQTSAANSNHLNAVADFFDVSTDYLLGRKEKDSYEGEEEPEDIRIMHRGVQNMSKEDREKALKMFETFFDNWDDYTKEED